MKKYLKYADGGAMAPAPGGGDPAAQGGAPGGMPGGDPAAGGAPQPGAGGAPGGGDPMAQVQQMVAEWSQTGDPQTAQAICSMLAQAMGIAPGGADPAAAGGGAPGGDPMAGGGAPGGDPMAGGAPAFRKGGKLGEKIAPRRPALKTPVRK